MNPLSNFASGLSLSNMEYVVRTTSKGAASPQAGSHSCVNNDHVRGRGQLCVGVFLSKHCQEGHTTAQKSKSE